MQTLPLNKLLHGDCLELLPQLPDSSIDAVITDPPYGITGNYWDNVPDLTALWNEWLRVLKPDGYIVVFCNFMFGSQVVNACPRKNFLRYDLVWRKSNYVGFLNARYQPLRAHENILVFGKPSKNKTYNPQMTQGKPYRRKGNATRSFLDESKIITRTAIISDGLRYPVSVINCAASQSVLHPTEKPIGILEWLVNTYTNKGDVVLDCFAGSGTLAIAALKTGRKYICIELQEEYCKKIDYRIAQYTGNYGIEIENFKKEMTIF